MSKVFKLFSNCIPVSGYSRSVICDIQRNSFEFIPNGLFQLLEKYEGNSLENIKKDFSVDEQGIINDYFNFLIENEYLFYCDQSELDYFPPVDKTWHSPFIISSAIIDISCMQMGKIDLVLKKLNDLGCKHYLIISKEFKPINFWKSLIAVSQKYRIFSIEVSSDFFEEYNNEVFYKFVADCPLIERFVCYNSPETFSKDLSHDKVYFTYKQINCNQVKISHKDFRIELSAFIEAHSYNTFFNQKVYIDSRGDIFNTPNTNESFGNVFIDDLKTIVNLDKFQFLWYAKKDKIDICQDCEFRYFCHDQRVPIEKNGFFINDIECAYNPFITKWSDEEGYITVKQWRSQNLG